MCELCVLLTRKLVWSLLIAAVEADRKGPCRLGNSNEYVSKWLIMRGMCKILTV